MTRTLDPIQEATLKTVEGLLLLIPHADDEGPTSLSNIYKMASTLVRELETFPIDKASRWLGFIQGVMACRGLIDVNEERDRTRPFFHEAYASTGLAIPPTREL